jgi:hypothetical protein
VKVHLLRRESVTPIAIYIARCDEQPDSFDRWLDFGALLLYREREYRSMYRSALLFGRLKPAPAPDSPFQPYDLTAEAAGHLVDAMQVHAPLSPDDLFGLKRSALDGLHPTLRPVKAHAFGWLVAARLHADLLEQTEAAAAEARAAVLGEKRFTASTSPRGIVKAVEAFAERVRKRALRVRTAVEGEAFTRFLTTEGAFCEQERAATLAEFHEANVPDALRALVPLARQIGVGDDACRGWFIQKMPRRARLAASQMIAQHAAAIDAWLATCDQPHEGEAAAFFWLRAAGEEL